MLARGAALALIIVAMSACGLSASFDGTHYRCDVSSECPRGMECEGGFCGGSATDGDGGTGDGDAGGGEADADTRSIIERACPGDVLDSDTFDFFAGTRWYKFENGGDGTIDTIDGVIRGDIDVVNGRVGLVSVESWPLEDVEVAFRIPEGAPRADTYVALEIINLDEEALLTIYRDGDVVVAEQTEPPGPGVVVGEALYAAADQAVWRIRVQDEAVVYEVSPDALLWTELAAESNAALPEAFRVRMVLETGGDTNDYVQDLDDMVVCGGL